MNILIVYDLVFGNTEKIAQAIGKAFNSIESIRTTPVSEVSIDMISGLDILIVGSPTRGFRPTEAITKFLKLLSKNTLKGVKVAAFDTRISLDTIDSSALRFIVKTGGYAAASISKELKNKGGILLLPPEGFLVTGEEGPLKDGEMERAAESGKKILAL